MSWVTYLQALQAAALVQLCWIFLSIWTEPLRIVYIPMPDIPQKYHNLYMWKVWLVAAAVWVLAILWLILHLEEILFLAFMWRMRRTIWLNPSNSGNYSRVQKSIENFVFRPKMAIFRRAGMREGGLSLPLAFQYLIPMIWRACDLKLFIMSGLKMPRL